MNWGKALLVVAVLLVITEVVYPMWVNSRVPPPATPQRGLLGLFDSNQGQGNQGQENQSQGQDQGTKTPTDIPATDSNINQTNTEPIKTRIVTMTGGTSRIFATEHNVGDPAIHSIQPLDKNALSLPEITVKLNVLSAEDINKKDVYGFELRLHTNTSVNYLKPGVDYYATNFSFNASSLDEDIGLLTINREKIVNITQQVTKQLQKMNALIAIDGSKPAPKMLSIALYRRGSPWKVNSFMVTKKIKLLDVSV